MCGIAGILSADPADIFTDRLKKMTGAIAHRGPNGERTWIAPGGLAGFGHRRLSVIDLSEAAAQPMHAFDRYTIVHNGEIYNYLELRELLAPMGYHFSSGSDTEVILAAYDRYGAGCLEHFDGMFAFAIWDEKEKKLFMARDRLGEKPLYYYHDDRQFLFASEMKALWAAGVKKEANRKMVFNFLTLGYTQNPADGSETFYQHIYRLPPRSLLVYDATRHNWETTVYWSVQIADDTNPNEENTIGEFTHLFSRSVHRRLRSDIPLGTSLSGGLDSSSVVAAIQGGGREQGRRQGQKGLTGRLQTFSAVFPGFEKDESSFIRAVSGYFPIDNHTVTPTAGQLIDDFELLIHHQEEPFSSASIYAQFAVYRLAAQHGVSVLLDGQGADELLAGYHKYYHWYWQELYRKDKRAFLIELEAARQSGADDRWSWRNRLAASLPVYAGLFLKKKRTAQQRRSKDLSRDFVDQYGTSYYEIPRVDQLSGALYYNSFMNGLEELLRYADRNAMAHGVEVRLPFLESRLVEFLFSLPSHFKIRDGWTKWLLRASMEGFLPPEIVWRKDKTGFEAPQRDWMQHPALQDYIRSARHRLVDAGILQASALHKKIQPQTSYAAENPDWRYLVTATTLGL